MNTEHNFIENELMILSKETMDLFFQHEDPGALIALYLSYYYIAKWQKTNQIKASISYTAKRLHWGEKKVRHHKQQLIALGLIEDIKNIDKTTKKVKGWYIKVKYIWKKETMKKVIHIDENIDKNHPSQKGQGGKTPASKTTLAISHSVDFNHPNALSANSLNALSAVNGVVKGGKTAPEGADPGKGAPPSFHADSFKEKHRSFLVKLPNLDIEDGQKEYLLGEIRAVLGWENGQSDDYRKLMICKVQPTIILQKLAEVQKDPGVNNRAKLFTYKIEQYVLTQQIGISRVVAYVGEKGGESVMAKGRGRGFASMDPAKQRVIASKGGRSAHAKGTAHKWTSEEARAAGRKGGRARHGLSPTASNEAV